MNSCAERLILICLIIIIVGVTVGCSENSQPYNNSKPKSEFSESQTSSESEMLDSIPPLESATITKFGVTAAKIPNFETHPISQTPPVVFNENEKYGYKDSEGNILIPAKYTIAREFYNGVGKVRLDNNNQYEWLYVSSNGNIVNYDSIGAFYENLWLATATKSGKYGLINTDFEEILPFEYDNITLSHSDKDFACYAIKDGNIVQLDLVNKIIYSYEPYNNQKSSYVDSIDISDYNIAIIDNMVTVNGETDIIGNTFPFAILNMIEFDVYQKNQKVFTGKGKITDGEYDNTLLVDFDFFKTFNEEFFAIPSGQNAYPRPNNIQTNVELYDDVVKQFLKENSIEETPYTIGKVLTGDLFDNGVNSALIQVSTTNKFKEERWSDNWSEEQYKKNKAAVFSAILLLPDAEEHSKYRVLKKEIRQDHHAIMSGGIYLRGAAQLYGDSKYEVLLENAYYESFDFSVISLESN